MLHQDLRDHWDHLKLVVIKEFYLQTWNIKAQHYQVPVQFVHLYISKSDPSRININRNLYVLQSVKTQWEVIKSKEEGHYYFQRLNRAMIHLATNPGPRQVGMQRTVIGPISIIFCVLSRFLCELYYFSTFCAITRQ